MIKLTIGARNQRDRLLRHYKNKNYVQAGRYLLSAIRTASEKIQNDPGGGEDFPSPYEQVRSYGFRWIKAHIYWISWTVVDETAIITNILWEQGDIPNTTLNE